MQPDISENSLKTFEALASDVRIKIIQLLSDKQMNIKDLASALNLSSAIISKHVKKLEEANLIKTERIPGISGLQKVSILKVDQTTSSSQQKFILLSKDMRPLFLLAIIQISKSNPLVVWLMDRTLLVKWMNH